MNRGLLAFAIFLMLAGAAAGFIPLVIIGFLLLFPAFLTGSRKKVPLPKPVPSSRGGGRTVAASRAPPTTPLQVSTPEPAPTQVAGTTTISPSATESRSSGSLQPLFPAQMFLTLNPVQYQKVEPTKKEQPHAEDMTELIGLFGAMALIRFLSRRKR